MNAHKPRRQIQVPRRPFHEHHFQGLVCGPYRCYSQYRAIFESIPPALVSSSFVVSRVVFVSRILHRHYGIRGTVIIGL
jgi:hypothetical protein